MPDFSRPEYASYIQLCRELGLKREWRDGDWCWCSTHQDPVGFICLNYDWQDPIDRTQMPTFWLPSLADWLEMLKAADWWRRYELAPLAGGDYRITADGPPVIVGPSGNSDLAYPRRSGVAATYEEAAARLYVAVTRSPADPAPPPAAR